MNGDDNLVLDISPNIDLNGTYNKIESDLALLGSEDVQLLQMTLIYVIH